MKAVNPQKQYTEVQKAFASHIKAIYNEGTDKKKSLNAIAADMVEFIYNDVQAISLADLLLERKPAFNGTVKWNKMPTHTAYWLDEDGEFVRSKDNKSSVTPAARLITASAAFSLLDLKRGDVASITDQADSARDDIVNKINAYIFDLYDAAAEATMSVTSIGSLLTTAMDEALSLLEDQGRTPVMWVGRASRFSDIKNDTSLGDPLTSDLKSKGVQAITYGGANFLYAPGMSADTVYLISELKPGKIQDEFPLEQEQVKADKKLEMSVDMSQTTRFGITNPYRYSVITIT